MVNTKFLVLKSEEVVVEVKGKEFRGMATANQSLYEFITRRVPIEFMRDVDSFTLTAGGRHVDPILQSPQRYQHE